jgi:hypothetical protein
MARWPARRMRPLNRQGNAPPVLDPVHEREARLAPSGYCLAQLASSQPRGYVVLPVRLLGMSQDISIEGEQLVDRLKRTEARSNHGMLAAPPPPSTVRLMAPSRCREADCAGAVRTCRRAR